MRVAAVLGLLLVVVAVSGCATVTGTVAGPVTGFVDIQTRTYHENQEAFDRNPMLYGLSCVVAGPCGFVTGPLCGFFKGGSLDIERLVGKLDAKSYSDAFGTCGLASVWRPFTWEWPGKPAKERS